MWTRLLFVALVAASAVQAWNPNTEYSYKVQSRTLSALHQVGDQYSGMLTRATLALYAASQNRLQAKIINPEYADVHQSLPGGWGSPINEQSLEWQKLDMTDKTFIIQLRNGVIDRIIVNAQMPEWEINMIKGIVSQLQVDTRAENFISSRLNQLPTDDSEQAVYKTMEDSVTGKCEVLYDISPLPEYVLQSQPQLVPKPAQNPNEEQILDIVKSTNYSSCDQRPVFHHGFGGNNDWAAASNKMGQFFARSSVSRIVVTGRPSNNLIQSSVTTNKVILSPAVYNNQKGMVVSRMNLTLLSAHSSEAKQQWETSEQPTLEIKDLVYELEHPSNQEQRKQERSSEEREQGMNRDNSEERLQGAAAQRFRRTLKPAQQEQHEREQRDQRKNWQSRASFESESEEDSSISNEEWTKRQPNMNDAPAIPFLPYFIAHKGKPINGQMNVPQKVAAIAREVAKELQNPKEVPQKATLSKFTILIRLIQTMSTEQLNKATEQLSHSEESSHEAKAAWKVYRDAVSQAGTGPALVAIKKWIDAKKVQGEEAAQMLAQIPQAAVIPNKHYVQFFFNIAKSEVVKSQQHLNTTAILAFTELVRKAQVDKRFAHNGYPTHTFGRMNPNQVPAVTRDYIPYLAQELRQAVREGDSVRMQTYVRALGNVAHPKILSVLEPYLEGQKQVSDFQRLHMVMALNQIRKVQPSLARAILYRLYKNKAETSEIRTAAVYLLMKNNPQANMLQRLAESVQDEHSKQVRTAVKSALESAASSTKTWELAENAQAAINLLNNTVFGPEYSRIQISSGKVPEMNIVYHADLSAIGSEDYLAPKATFAHFRQILSGLRLRAHSAGYMASSTKDLINLIAAQFGKSFPQPERTEHMESENGQQVEGNFLYKSVLGERFFAFDNHTIERMPEELKHMIQKMSQGQNFNIQKMYNKQALTLAFPTASGLPFVYQLMKPTVVSAQGKAQAEIQPEISREWKSAKASAEVKLMYSTKTEAAFGFVAPFNGKMYSAGSEQDAQIALPIRAELEIKNAPEGSEIKRTNMNLKLQPLKPDEDSQIAILRSKPYTAQQKVADLKTTQMKTIHVQKPKHLKFVVGRETTGMAFRFEASTEREHLDFTEALRQLQKFDVLSAMASANREKNIHKYEYTLTYDHDHSHAKAVQFTAQYGQLSKKRQSDSYSYNESDRTQSKGEAANNLFTQKDNLAIPTHSEPDSSERLDEFLHRVADSLQISNAAAIDLSAQFKGEREAVYIATISGAASPMKDSYAALAYMRHSCANGHKNAIAMYPSIQIPNAPLVDYQKAINKKPIAHIDTKITFGENLEENNSQVQIKAKMDRSAEREQYVREQPISALCEQQVRHGNNFLPACQNATLAAGHMDQYRFEVKYIRVPESVKNATYKAYSLVRHLGWEYHSEDLVSANNEQDKIDLKVRFSPCLRSANVSIQAPKMNAKFENVRLARKVSAAMVAHPNFKPSELVSQYVFGKNYNPTCTIDKSAVSTFDNKTFELALENEWYLVAQYVPKEYQHTKYSPAKQVPFIKVQTRQNAKHEKEVKMFLGTKDVVEIFPRDAQEQTEIKVNNKVYKSKSGKQAEVESRVDNRVFVRFNSLPDGTTRIEAPEYNLEIVYDTNTFVLKVGNQYRGALRGLCGSFDGETETDFTTPKKCIAKDARIFTKSITVDGEGRLKNPNFQRQPSDCIYKKTIRTNVVNEREAGHEQESVFKSAKTERCTSYRTMVAEKDGELCFSVRPLPTCSSQCQSTGEKEQTLGFHCVADSSSARHMAKKALKGVALDVASKGANKQLSVKVPESCQA